MNKTTQLIIKKTNLSKTKKKELNRIKHEIYQMAGNIREYATNIIKNLFIIEDQKLFYFDNCQSMKQFIERNKIPERLSINYATITQKLKIERYINKNKFDDEIRKIGFAKLNIISSQEINEKKQVIELSKYSINTLKEKFYKKSPASGQFMRATFKKRKNTEIIVKEFEIPINNKKIFYNSLKELCKLYKVEII